MEAIRELSAYRKSIEEKNQQFVSTLLEHGIVTAREALAGGTHHMPERITFSKNVEVSGQKITAYLVGTGEPFESHWVDAHGTDHHDLVCPMSMMEFGSAGLALPPTYDFLPKDGEAGGRGTFSVSGNENKTSWTFYIRTGEKSYEQKVGTAIAPTRPLYNAIEQMRSEINSVAREVFGGD